MSNSKKAALADAARKLVQAQKQAVLAVLKDDDGYPYAAAVDYLAGEQDDVIMLLSDLSEHSRYLQLDSRASLLVAAGFVQQNMLAEARVVLLGKVIQLEDKSHWQDRYLAVHSQAEQYIGFADFKFFRFQVEQVRYIAGFGKMAWLDATTYRDAG